MSTIVVIPAHNEARKIYTVVQGVIQRGFDVVVVDDGSSDNTSDEARRAGAVVLRHFINRGYGSALTTGNAWALQNQYDVIVHFDGDGQHNPDEIKNLANSIIREKVDVVIGSRFIKESVSPPVFRACPEYSEGGGLRVGSVPFIRKILIKLAIIFTWIFSGIKLSDAHNGFRAFNRLALEKISCRQDGMAYASEIVDQIAEQKLRIGEVPVTIAYTDYSKSKGESNIKKMIVGFRFLWGKVIK